MPSTVIEVSDSGAVRLDPHASHGQSLVLHNDGPSTVWIGAEGVTPETGVPVLPGPGPGFTLGSSDHVYAVAATGGAASLRVLTTYLPLGADMATESVAPVKARVARITRLDSCGAPIIGASSVLTTAGFIRVQATPNYDDGARTTQKNAWGDNCVDEQDDPTMLDVGLQIDFCKVNPAVSDLTVGSRTLLDGANLTGAAFSTAAITDRFGLELWQKIAGVDACAGGEQGWVYWQYRNIGRGKVGALTHENGLLTFSVTATGKAGDPADWPIDLHGEDEAWLPAALGATEPFAFNVVRGDDPPTATDVLGAIAA